MKSEKKKSTWVGKRKAWIEQNRIKWEVFLLFFGVALGFIASLGWGYWQDYQTDRYTAQGIYNELKNSNGLISGLAYTYKRGGAIVNGSNVGNPVPGDSFISPLSMYPAIGSNLQRFDNKLSDNVTMYYQNLSSAENDRVKLDKIRDIPQNTPLNQLSFNDEVYLSAHQDLLDDMENRIIYCAYQIPIIEKQLHDIYGVQ